MSAVLQLCIRLLPFPMNIPYFLISVSIIPQTACTVINFCHMKKTMKHNFKNAFKHYISFQDKGKERHRLSFTGTFTSSDDVCY